MGSEGGREGQPPSVTHPITSGAVFCVLNLAAKSASSRNCCSLQAKIQSLPGMMALRQNLEAEMRLLTETGRGWRAEVLDLETRDACVVHKNWYVRYVL